MRLFSFTKKNCLYALIAMFLVLVSTQAFAEKEKITNVEASAEKYVLGAGDKLRITVFGEEDLSGEFDVDGSGQLSMPLIGNVKAGGITLDGLEAVLVSKYKAGYLRSPRVSVEVLNFRPFFILGEVEKPGSYPYVNGLRVINAVALAGGYTYRARTDRVMLQRVEGKEKKEMEATEDMLVFPGDVLRVTERLF